MSQITIIKKALARIINIVYTYQSFYSNIVLLIYKGCQGAGGGSEKHVYWFKCVEITPSSEKFESL